MLESHQTTFSNCTLAVGVYKSSSAKKIPNQQVQIRLMVPDKAGG